MAVIRLFRSLLIGGIASVVVACGGGLLTALENGGVGSGGTGISLGTLIGFGSLVVDGTTYSSASPSYFTGTASQESAPGSASDVILGSRLEVTLDAQGAPSAVTVAPQLVGPVEQLGTTSFSVNGLQVRVGTPATSTQITYFSGLNSFSELRTGMPVEVHGAYGIDASGQPYLQASLIKQLTADSQFSRLTGTVSNWNGNSQTFMLGSVLVSLKPSTTLVPAGVQISNGQLVNVWSPAALQNSHMTASVVRVRTLVGVTGSVQLSGVVSQLQGSSFQLDGIVVDGSAVAVAAQVALLRNGTYVTLQGVFNPVSGRLVAAQISVATQPGTVVLHGTITDFVDASNFLVRGVPVNASQAVFTSGTASGLRNGLYVDVTGQISGNTVSAKNVSVSTTAPAGGTVSYLGTVSQFNSQTGQFLLSWQDDGQLQQVQISLASNVAFSNGISTDLVNGVRVAVEASAIPNSSTVSAYAVAFRPNGFNGGAAVLESDGLVYNLTPTSFQVNGLTIQINGVAAQGAAFVDGAKAEVQFVSINGVNLAQAIEIDP